MDSTQATQKHITIYSTPTCTHCHHLKDYLTSKGFVYEDIDVTKDFNAMMAALQKSGQKGCPLLI